MLLSSRSFAARRLAAVARQQQAPFHATSRSFVKVGDAIPDVDLREGSPGNKVNLAKELKGKKGLIIGVPAAFSPSCSEKHIPQFIEHAKLKDAGEVYVVSVNDPFVTKAWGATLDPTSKSGVRFLADSDARFNGALDLLFDSAAIFGNPRSKRYALLVENDKVKEVFIEPDNTGVDASSASSVLG